MIKGYYEDRHKGAFERAAESKDTNDFQDSQPLTEHMYLAKLSKEKDPSKPFALCHQHVTSYFEINKGGTTNKIRKSGDKWIYYQRNGPVVTASSAEKLKKKVKELYKK